MLSAAAFVHVMQLAKQLSNGLVKTTGGSGVQQQEDGDQDPGPSQQLEPLLDEVAGQNTADSRCVLERIGHGLLPSPSICHLPKLPAR